MAAACARKGVEFRFETDVRAQPELLAPFDRIVIATGADYRFGLGPLARAALDFGAGRWLGLSQLFSQPKLRDWFYYRARRGTGDAVPGGGASRAGRGRDRRRHAGRQEQAGDRQRVRGGAAPWRGSGRAWHVRCKAIQGSLFRRNLLAGHLSEVMAEIRFLLNGEPRAVTGVPPTTTVLDWLRLDARLTGTKEGCAEGDCGACTIVVGRPDGERLNYEAVNSCLMLLPQLDGCDCADGRRSRGPDGTLHPVQQALVDADATQCGFCTPGFAMAMFAFHHGGEGAERHAHP